MKAAQIDKYSKYINVKINDIPMPKIKENEVLIKVKTAAVNPLDILNIIGKVKLIQNYSMPLTLGNECCGIIESVGKNVLKFKEGDVVYTRLPVNKIGAFAEYIAVESDAIAKIPRNYSFDVAVSIPLTGLTAYQCIKEELQAQPNKTVLIPGGSGSFGQMAVPIAKKYGLNVIVTGNDRAKESVLNLGADMYIEYKKEKYWETLSNIDYIIDTLGEKEFNNEISVLKEGGILVSLRGIPNREFAEKNNFSFIKKTLFSFAGSKYDRVLRKKGGKYKFMFVHSSGKQLEEITKIVEENNIIPRVDSRRFSLFDINQALNLVSSGHTNGKIIIYF